MVSNITEEENYPKVALLKKIGDADTSSTLRGGAGLGEVR